MDDVDKSFIEEQNFVFNAIYKATRFSSTKLEPKKECYYCGEEIEKDKLFCNSECANKYEKINKIK